MQKQFQFSMFLCKYVIIIIAFDTKLSITNQGSLLHAACNVGHFFPGIDNRILYTLGPKPHFLGYVSRSMITRLILATIPWSQPAIVAVVISAMAEIHRHILDSKQKLQLIVLSASIHLNKPVYDQSCKCLYIHMEYEY
jgi:hypothetical protein